MIDELIKELENSECGNASFDEKMYIILNGSLFEESDESMSDYEKDLIIWAETPDYTLSLDATENALPDGWSWKMMSKGRPNYTSGHKNPKWWVNANNYGSTFERSEDIGVHHKSLPIARSIALLKAHKAMNGE